MIQKSRAYSNALTFFVNPLEPNMLIVPSGNDQQNFFVLRSYVINY